MNDLDDFYDEDEVEKKPRFVNISASRKVRGAMEFALRDPGCVVHVKGPPGMGKTTALLHHGGPDQLRAVYCCIDPSSESPGGMMKALLKALRMPTEARTTWDISEGLKRILSSNRRGRPLLVVDEFQDLTLKALRGLLHLHETCDTSLVLSGNDQRLAKTRSYNVALDKIRNRIGTPTVIGPPDEADCREMGIEFNVELSDGSHDVLATYGRQTSVRELARLLRLARNFAGVGTIRIDHLKTAFLSMGGRDKDIKQLLGIEASGKRRPAR